jgi:uncharacterized membrane protein
MISTRQRALAGTISLALVSTVIEVVTLPEGARIVAGVSLIFLLPGFSVTFVIFSYGKLFRCERILASLGISVAMSICIAVLLAALPIGLSRAPFTAALGGITIIISAYAWFFGKTERTDGIPEIAHDDGMAEFRVAKNPWNPNRYAK